MLEARILDETSKDEFNKVVKHPLQSWNWGEFKEKMDCIAERIGFFEDDKLVDGLQVIFSKIPKSKYTVGYSAKGTIPTNEQISLLKELAKKHNAIFIKLEPNLCFPANQNDEEDHNSEKELEEQDKKICALGLKHGKAFFTRYDFHLDIDKSEEELMASFHSKTRYNIRLARRKGVSIIDNSTEEGIENYIRLMEETTKRQKFFNHNGEYFKQLFKTFPKENFRIFEARYEDKVLTSWLLFNFNGTLYYPYGASSNEHREVMPNNLIAWEAIKYGKEQGAKLFDLWGCLGTNPDKTNPWYGFHKFKSGYKPLLVKYVGTYDLVINGFLYKSFHLADKLRRKILQAKKR